MNDHDSYRAKPIAANPEAESSSTAANSTSMEEIAAEEKVGVLIKK